MRLIAILVFITLAFSLVAQVLPSVDIDTAQTQIDQFLRENELLQERIEGLQTTNSSLQEDMITWATWLEAIAEVSDRLVNRANQLIEILSELASKSVMERAQSVLDRYYVLKELLDQRSAELEDRTEAAKTSIERNTIVIADLQRKITSNLENVDLLKAAIERSAGSEETVNSYIEDLEKAIDEAENAIRLPF